MSHQSVVLVAVLLLSVPVAALAQMQEAGSAVVGEKAIPVVDQGMAKDKGNMKCKDKMCAINKFGMPRMPIVVATSDGGVVVVTGNVMTKYDQDLDVIGQVNLKMDKGCKGKMKGQCPKMNIDANPVEENQSTHMDAASTQRTDQPVMENESVVESKTTDVMPSTMQASPENAAPSVTETEDVSADAMINAVGPMIDIPPAAEMPSFSEDEFNQTMDTLTNEQK